MLLNLKKKNHEQSINLLIFQQIKKPQRQDKKIC